MSAELAALRSYVTAKDSAAPRTFGGSMIELTVSHSNLTQRWIELRFELKTKISEVKSRLYKHGGTAPQHQRLVLIRGNNVRTTMDDDDKYLGYYSPASGDEILIVDLDANSLAKSGWLEDTSLVEKYVMSEEDYEAREGTVRKFKQKQLDEKFSKEETQEVGEEVRVGKRCEVHPGGRRGEIKFVGKDEEELLGAGWWIGVALDEPLGKNDGAVKGKRFFKCAANCGVMVRPDRVLVGDFPVRSLSDDEDDER